MIGKLLGVDHGLKRIGVAASDALGISARELAIIESEDAAYDELKRLAHEQNAIGLVVGVPSNEGNTEQADIVRKWVTGLEAAIDLPVVLWDEQLTSADAKELARQQKRPPRAPIDDLAARVLLQSYINALADGLAKPPGA